MEQVKTFGFRVRGAAADELFDGHALALEAWGDRADDKNSGLLAMAYLWRRFGPPWLGGDDHKELVLYVLTTDDPQVFLSLGLSGCGLTYSVGYLAHESIRNEASAAIREWCRRYDEWWWSSHPEFEDWEDAEENTARLNDIYWHERDDQEIRAKAVAAIGEIPLRIDPREWRTAGGVVHRVNAALFDGLKELERPVYVRDCPFNLFGRCDDGGEAAERSKYAGYGVPKEAMDGLIAQREIDSQTRTNGPEEG